MSRPLDIEAIQAEILWLTEKRGGVDTPPQILNAFLITSTQSLFAITAALEGFEKQSGLKFILEGTLSRYRRGVEKKIEDQEKWAAELAVGPVVLVGSEDPHEVDRFTEVKKDAPKTPGDSGVSPTFLLESMAENTIRAYHAVADQDIKAYDRNAFTKAVEEVGEEAAVENLPPSRFFALALDLHRAHVALFSSPKLNEGKPDERFSVLALINHRSVQRYAFDQFGASRECASSEKVRTSLYRIDESLLFPFDKDLHEVMMQQRCYENAAAAIDKLLQHVKKSTTSTRSKDLRSNMLVLISFIHDLEPLETYTKHADTVSKVPLVAGLCSRILEALRDLDSSIVSIISHLKTAGVSNMTTTLGVLESAHPTIQTIAANLERNEESYLPNPDLPVTQTGAIALLTAKS